MAVHGWSRPYGCGLAFAVVHQGSTNCTVFDLPLFCVELLCTPIQYRGNYEIKRGQTQRPI